MNKILCVIFVWLISCGCLSAVDLQQEAKQRRIAAEQALEQQRANILQERQALLDKFAILQQKLSGLKQSALSGNKQLQRLQDQVAQRDHSANEAADNLKLLINRVSSAVGVPAPNDVRAAHCEVLWRKAINERLTNVTNAAHIKTQQQDISSRKGEPISTQLIHYGAVQALAVSADALNSGFVIQADNGYVINGPVMDQDTFELVRSFDATQGGFLLADIEGSLKTQELRIETWSSWLEKGGFFVWPIIAVGILAFLLASERIIHVLRLRIQPQFLQKVMEHLHKSEFQAAEAAVSTRSNPLQRVLHCGLEVIDKDQAIRESALEASLLAEEADLDRSRSLLAVLAAVAPLLGLLGTVTGMISTFQGIALYGTANPALLSNGISEALITTQLGLVVAVPILLVHGFINRIAEKRRIILEQAAGHVLSVQKP